MNQREPDTFKLQVRVEIQRCGPNGEYLGSRDQLTVEESVQLQARGFLEVAAVLGRFHDLGERIRNEAERHDHADEPVSMTDVFTAAAADEDHDQATERMLRELADLADILLAQFTEIHNPDGCGCLRSRWVRPQEIAEWRGRLQELRT